MKDMPKSVIKWYKMWISCLPQTWHPDDLERFYMFVSVLLTVSKKQRTEGWLGENLKDDCKKLSSDDIYKYCEIYRHIRDFKNVWKSNQAKLIAEDEMERRIRSLAKNREI